MLSLEDAEVGKPDLGMWKFVPDPVLSIDSTVGNGSGSLRPVGLDGAGGVSALWSGDVYVVV